jgi:drug/metabolite transporter (DMT)-like permease
MPMTNFVKNKSAIHLDATVAGPLFMLSASLIFTVNTLLIKLLDHQFTAWHIGFLRFFGGMVVIILIFGRHKNPYKGHNMRLLIIRGVTGSIAYISAITAIRLLPVSTALVIFYSFPAFSAIFSFLIYRETIGKIQVVCIIGVIIGVGILFDVQLDGGHLGKTMALIASAFAGLTVTLIHTLRKTDRPAIIYLYLSTIGTLVTLPKFVIHPILPSTSLEWVMILGIIFTSTTGQLLMNQGFFYCKGWEGGVLMSSEVIFTAVVGIVFLDDLVSVSFWIGGLIIFTSIVVLNRVQAGIKKKPVNQRTS